MLSSSEVKGIDKSGLYKIYEDWPIHCREAYKTEVNAPETSNVKKIIFAGMGGSATPGDILQDWLKDSIDIPFCVVKDYHLPKFAGKDTFVIAVSCSGNTEETLSIVHESLKAGCKVVTISSGGLLEEMSLKNNIPYNRIVFTLLSRASFPYIFYVSAKILEYCGFIKGLEDQISNSIRVVEDVSKHISIEAPIKENLSKKIAIWLYDSLPLIYGSNLNRAVAIRFKNVLNENSKMHAIVDVMPELCHNEIVAWEGIKDKPLKPLFLRYRKEPPEVKVRFEIFKELIRDAGFEILEAWSWGEDQLSKIISLLYILDFASLYLAVLRGFDPTPTVSIEKMKGRLKLRLDYIDKYILKK
ncbi:MAG: bifunctional phosphoglucose/phosphomannose isomerase [archaeon]|nr:bifunctional phosphoglucose/phosphomannose isomerase [archaeon]MCP8314868.1 bifunctional phosphoglucose/phosphomannose isomerase [archaeon]MCP8317823.1 bifunctional phosphoglucose/phosphomannose isomerase [archaeon]